MKKLVMLLAVLCAIIPTISVKASQMNGVVESVKSEQELAHEVLREIDEEIDSARQNGVEKNLTEQQKSELDTFLHNKNEEKLLYIDEHPELAKELIITEEEKNKGMNEQSLRRSYSGNSNIPDWNFYGDIFVHKSTVTGDKQFVGHAGIGDFDKGYTIESYPDGGVQFKFQYQNYWLKSKNEGTAYQLRVYGATRAHYMGAVRHAQSKLHEQYNWLFSSKGKGYYCSELVAYSWASQGFDINWGVGMEAIHPIYLAWSSNTYQV